MSGTSAGARPEWAPAPSSADASLSHTDAGAAFKTVFLGLVIAAVDLRIDGFDLLVDVIGFGMAARGLLSLSGGGLAIPDRARAAFRLAFAAAVVSAVFALGSVFVDESSLAISGLDNVDDRTALAVLTELAASVVVLTVLWQLLLGIMIIATEQEAVVLFDDASKLRNRFATAIIISTLLSWGVDLDVGPIELFIFFAVFIWLGLQLRSVSYTAAEVLSLPTRPIQMWSNPARLSPLSQVLLGLAAVIAVLSLFFPPSSTNSASDAPFDSSGWRAAPSELADPSPVEQAVQRQAPALVQSPVELSAAAEPQPSCPSLPATALAIDLSSGETLWTRSIPSALEPPALVGTSVLFADPWLGRLLPSVSAIDVATGEIRWQSHVEAQELTAWGAANGTATYHAWDPWSFDRSSRLLTMDSSGAIVNEAIADAPTQWSDQPESRFVTGGQTVKASINGSGFQPNLWLRRADGSLVQGDPIPFDDIYSRIGNDSSLGDPIQIGSEIVLVVMGSHQGPNSKVVAYDAESGQHLWSREHLRSAAVAALDGRDVVVYDKRNTKPTDAPSTRDLYVVEGTDPDSVLWSAELSVNADGGNGFLGATEAGLVFATADEARGNEAARLRLTTISGEREAPDRLVAAEGYGGGWSSRHLLTDDLSVMAADNRLVLLAADGTRSTIVFDQPVQHVARVNDTLVVVTGDSADSCG